MFPLAATRSQGSEDARRLIPDSARVFCVILHRSDDRCHESAHDCLIAASPSLIAIMPSLQPSKWSYFKRIFWRLRSIFSSKTLSSEGTSRQNPSAHKFKKDRHGVEQLLRMVAGCISSTPAGPPVATLNRIIQVINVRFVISQHPNAL